MARLRRPTLWVLMAVLIVPSGCEALAIARPAVPLEVRTQPGEGTGFDPASVSAPPDTPVALTFTNVSALEHNLVFLDPVTVGTRAIVRPGESDHMEFATPAAGTYQFVCTIHEDMRGSLVVR